MDPVAFVIGPFSIKWYAIFITIGVLAALIVGLYVFRKLGINEDKTLDLLLVLVPAALIGARAYYVIFRWDYYSEHLNEIIRIWEGGIAVHGAILTVLFLGWYLAKRKELPFFKMIDIVAPFLLWAQGLGRWGNYVNQEAYGFEVSKEAVPWAMYIDGAWRHPTFLYECIWDVLAGCVLLYWLKSKHRKVDGEVVGLYCILYSIGRSLVEYFRTDSLMLGPVRAAWVVSGLLILFGIWLICSRRKKAVPRYEVLLAEARRVGGSVGYDAVLLPEGAVDLREAEAAMKAKDPAEKTEDPAPSDGENGSL